MCCGKKWGDQACRFISRETLVCSEGFKRKTMVPTGPGKRIFPASDGAILFNSKCAWSRISSHFPIEQK